MARRKGNWEGDRGRREKDNAEALSSRSYAEKREKKKERWQGSQRYMDFRDGPLGAARATGSRGGALEWGDRRRSHRWWRWDRRSFAYRSVRFWCAGWACRAGCPVPFWRT